jgi:hypothetical protein
MPPVSFTQAGPLDSIIGTVVTVVVILGLIALDYWPARNHERP